MKLQAKVILMMFSLTLLLGIPLLLTVKNAMHFVLMKDIEKRAVLSVSNISDEAVLGLKKRSESILLSLLQSAYLNTGATNVAALDQEGNVVAHTNVAEKGKRYTDSYTLKALKSQKPVAQALQSKGALQLRVAVPIHSIHESNFSEEFLLGANTENHQRTREGTITLDIPLKEAMQTEYKLFREIAAILFITGSIALFMIIFIMRQLLRPITHLSAGTARISQGDYGVQIPVSSSDELGSLTMDFNRMSKNLSETTVSKNYLGNILSHMVDPLIVMSTEGVIQMTNQATADLLGYSAHELEGERIHVLFVGRQHISATIEQETLISKGSVRNLELTLLTKEGEKVPVLFSSSMLKDSEGRTTGIIAVAKDMTERKKLENAIRQSEKLSAVGQLAAGVAHEINNPLGVILGFAQAAVRRLQPNNPLELPLKSIEKEALRCKTLVQDLLTFSRVSKIDREPLDINRAVEGAFSLILAQARMTRVEVKKELTANLPRILGNLNQIQQIIINLANNALDAIGTGTGSLTVITESVTEEHLSWVALRVIDTGPGIVPEILSRIFDPFFTTKPVGKGTGLGLSLVHEIIKKHSGTIDVQSSPGNTEFCIKFPVRNVITVKK